MSIWVCLLSAGECVCVCVCELCAALQHDTNTLHVCFSKSHLLLLLFLPSSTRLFIMPHTRFPSHPLTPTSPRPPLSSGEEASKRGRFTRAVISARLSFPFPSLPLSLSRTLSLPRSPSEIIKEPTSNPIQPCRTKAVQHTRNARGCSGTRNVCET